MNLSNVSDQIKKEFEELEKNAASLGGSEAAWWNNVRSQMPSRVEATKQNIEKYGYNGILGTICANGNIDKYLVLGLIATESNGDVMANVGSGGYQGCMQVDPDALPSPMGSDPKVNAQIGIETGVRMFKAKFQCFPDNVFLAIAAYNAGQGTVGEGIKSLSISEADMRWYNSIMPIAQMADSYWPGQGKLQEVGEYALKVMYAYTLFAGYEVKLGDLPQAAADLSGNVNANKLTGGQSAAANATVKVSQQPHGKHSDSIVESPDKLYCEPVYPDLISVSSGVPEYLAEQLNIPSEEMIPGADMVYQIPVSTLIKYGGQDAVNFSATNAALEEQRNAAFNPDEHRQAFKVPSSGKPANNNDPFPVDAKIEELELHQPRCKIDQIIACPEAASTAKATVKLSMDVERRLVKLENNMATILRYLMRIGSRMNINCVYYGGQVPSYEKYKCIRCLKDDRISDGQIMSLDQCLNCTRYEPLIGQVYDILNDQGLNLSQILDDCQMSYTTMDEYCGFIKSTEYQKDLETTELGADSVQNRLVNEQDFSAMWSAGVKMDWNLFPVEDQKPHINKNQNINGESYSPLSSYYGTSTNYGYAYTGGSYSNRIVQNKQMMDQIYASYVEGSTDEEGNETEKHIAYDAIAEAKSFSEAKSEQFVSDMTAYLGENISNLIKEQKTNVELDNLLVAAIVFATDQEADSVIVKLTSIINNLKNQNVSNDVLSATFYALDTKYLFGSNKNVEDKTFPRRLDKVTKIIEVEDTSGEGGGTTEQEVGFGLNWADVNNWDWPNFIEPLNINYLSNQRADRLEEKLYTFAKIAYIYTDLQAKCHTSNFDSDQYGFAFPFFEKDLNKIYYTSPFGPRGEGFHYGVDLAGDQGIDIHCIADGTVEYVLSPEEANGGGNMLAVRHANGYFSRYMHMSDIIVGAGQNVSKGQILGHLGNTGDSTGPHLHFEVNVGGAASDNAQDPCSFFPRLGAVPLGTGLGG